ncbi:MAG: DUF503 domain-containing protein [Anaerolineae bacterium]|nr:DUF503 domain-containing protein [Anaerolineae bacterium]
MAKSIIGLCELELYIAHAVSLKDKRMVIKSLLKRVHNQFNVGASEVDLLDSPQSALIAIVCVSNSSRHAHSMLQKIINWIESNYPEAMIANEQIEII